MTIVVATGMLETMAELVPHVHSPITETPPVDVHHAHADHGHRSPVIRTARDITKRNTSMQEVIVGYS